MAWAIETEALRKSFGATQVLQGLDLRVPKGGIFGFLGPNGAGKTTTIHILLGLVQPDEGAARVMGLDVRRQADAIRRRCGALLEHHGLYERLSAIENLALAGGLHGLPRHEASRRGGAALEELGLWDRRRDKLGTWSKGMKQRLAIARAMLHEPEVVFLDEPTNGFDPVAARALREDLRRIARTQGTTFFVTTHNLDEAQRSCDRVAILQGGRVAAEGPPSQLVARRPSVRIRADRIGPKTIAAVRDVSGVDAVVVRDGWVSVQIDRDDRVPHIVTTLARSGARIHEVTPERVGLEEAFLSILEAP